MNDTDLYWRLRGSYSDKKDQLSKEPREWLEATILDDQYNDFLRSRSDADEKDDDYADILNGKRIPYMGWFWRHLEFSDGHLPLGFDQGYVGFMANNKWDHHERNTTPEEFSKIMGFIDDAMVAEQRGGELRSIESDVRSHLKLLRDYLQTLPRVALTT